MLKLEQIKLRDNMLLIDMEVPQISDTINGIHKTEDQKELEARQTNHRIGEVILAGDVEVPLVQTILKQPTTHIVGRILLFEATVVEPFRIPVEGYEKRALILIRLDYILGQIVEE
jgi:hypothetical protein